MKFIGDYHIHTYTSDGNTTINGVYKHAKKMGLEEIAITDHSFATAAFGMTESKFLKQEKQISQIKDLKIYHGLEANIINESGSIDIPKQIIKKCDFIIVGFHRYLKPRYIQEAKEFILTNGFGSLEKRQELIDKNTKAFLKCINNQPVDVIAHLNHRALVDVKQILETAKKNDIYIELNESHVQALIPFANDIVESGVKLLVCSDAHWYFQIGKTINISKFIEDYKIPKDRIYGLENKPIFKDKK